MEMRARREGRGFFTGSLLCVNDRNAEFRLPYPNGKTAEMRTRQGVARTLQGAYIDVRDRENADRNVEMRRICVVF